MRILWLTPYLPIPIFGAGTRVFNLVKSLATSCTIDLMANADAPPTDEMVRQLRMLCRSVEVVPRVITSQRHKRLRQFRSLVSRRPAEYWMYYSPRLHERIDQALRQAAYDMVILEHSFMGYYTLPQGVLTVLDQHNVESEILLRAGRHERSALRRAYNGVDYVKYRADEQRICRSVDLILATSPRDLHLMHGWGGLPPCEVIPNGVDTTYFVPPADAPHAEGAAGLVFTASMHYAPNVEAMLAFTAQTWPRIRDQVPRATLQIVGGNPPPEIVQLGRLPGVTVVGQVPDVRPYISAAQVVVAPLHIGGGTRLKIVEALAMGRAVVSTSLGCEGLEVQDGRHLLVADDPADFAERVLTLLRDPARRAALGRQGRHLVEERYDWRRIGCRMAALLRDYLAGMERGRRRDSHGRPLRRDRERE